MLLNLTPIQRKIIVLALMDEGQSECAADVAEVLYPGNTDVLQSIENYDRASMNDDDEQLCDAKEELVDLLESFDDGRNTLQDMIDLTVTPLNSTMFVENQPISLL